jgi:hypothetical protein
MGDISLSRELECLQRRRYRSLPLRLEHRSAVSFEFPDGSEVLPRDGWGLLFAF